MKVSIIGSNGFLSVAVAKFCNQNKWDVDMYGLNEPIGHKYNDFYRINLLKDSVDYENLIKSDIIVYASGAGIQSNLKENSYLIYALNVTVPVNMCNHLKANNFNGILVTFGSVFEMGQTKEFRAFEENDILISTCEASNDYTVSKRMLSRFINGYKHEFVHWHMYIPTIYGETESPHRLIPYTINAIKNGEKLSFTSGDQVRQYIYVGEVPMILAKAYKAKLPSGIYNIGGTETLSVKEIVSLIHDELGCKVPDGCFGTAERKDVGMKYLVLDGLKLYSAIDYQPHILIKDIIKKY